MWIHQRTGPNSGFSISGGELLLVLLFVAALAIEAWPVAIGLIVIYGGYALLQRNPHKPGKTAARPDAEKAGPMAQNFYRRMDGRDSEFL